VFLALTGHGTGRGGGTGRAPGSPGTGPDTKEGEVPA
jgi:ABC-2 type transport system ATP-binding protein